MPKLIAIVDDEIEMEYLYTLMLEDITKKHEVNLKFFSDARLFETWLQTNQPDLILSDISMPYLSGLELGQRIRAAGKSITTYFVSGHDEYEFQDSLNEIGNFRYLTKPFETNQFIQFLKTDLSLQG